MRRKDNEKTGIFTKKNVIGLIIVMIMIMSSLGFMIMQGDNETNSDTYNGHKLLNLNNYWYINYAGKQIKLRFHPTVIDSIPLQNDARDLINNSKILFISINPGDKNIQYIEQIRFELEQEMPDLFKKYVLTGVTDKVPEYDAYSIVGCQNATIDTPVIYFTTEKNDSFDYSNYCLTVKASSGNDLFMMEDRFILGLAGIIK
jgi:hypothetical protein